MSYETPSVADLGALTDLTLSITIVGPEDGASKNGEQHHMPGLASLPMVP